MLCGQGTSLPDCQDYKMFGCFTCMSNDKEVWVKGYNRNCMRLQCPKCLEKVKLVKSYKAIRRIRAYKVSTIKLRHVVVSPPPEEELNHDYKYIRSKAIKSLRNVHQGSKKSLGGIMIVHHKRCEYFKGKKSYVKIGLHFHIIGYANINYRTVQDNFKRQNNYVVVDLKERNLQIDKKARLAFSKEDKKTFGTPENKGAWFTIKYALDHCGVDPSEKYKTVTWFGCLGYHANFKVPNFDDVVQCPVCLEKKRYSWIVQMDFVVEGSHDPPDSKDSKGKLYPTSSLCYPQKYHIRNCPCCPY